MSLKKIKKALTMVLTASVALSAAGCGKDVAKNNMTEEKTVETTVQESSSETISDDTKTTETAQYAMERSETESTKESESIQDITETYEDMSEYAIVEPETEGDLTSKQKNAVNMLNYIMTITQEINNSKESRLYLESAYSSLINNSDPGLIDTRTQERITNILDTLEQYRMIAEKRERLRYIYEQNRAQALRQAIPDPVGLLSAVSSGNILKSAASVIYMPVDAASSYQNAVTQTDLQYLQDGWQLEDEEAQELHNSRKSTFEYMVDMVRENSLPGEYALNQMRVHTRNLDHFGWNWRKAIINQKSMISVWMRLKSMKGFLSRFFERITTMLKLFQWRLFLQRRLGIKMYIFKQQESIVR